MNKKTTFNNQLSELTSLFLILMVGLSMIISSFLLYYVATN